MKGDASVCQRSLSSKAAAAMLPYRGVAAKPSSTTSSASKSTNRVVAVGAASVSGMPLTSYLRTGCEEFSRLHSPPESSMIAPTLMPTAHGADPAVYIASRSLVDGTPD